ncbi:hypothetical protein E4N62_18415 [Streptomyces sp. MNU76]|uniref:hypothetical protein n=1 Tax=Streptomyces sp. MNU76 TaxID=2560026 RepID=UPI001E30D963|nr:hypothetical protein [Streptomyces sp. MNU76]MCC9707066.1 hypothetical protein [Streptomyces sp. MNU76]
MHERRFQGPGGHWGTQQLVSSVPLSAAEAGASVSFTRVVFPAGADLSLGVHFARPPYRHEEFTAMTTAFGNPSPLPAGPTPLTDTSGLPTPESAFARPEVTQPTIVQPPGISGYLPPDILLPIVFAILVIIVASRTRTGCQTCSGRARIAWLTGTVTAYPTEK